MEPVAHRVGRLCSQATAGQLREYAQRFGAAEVLERIADAVGHGRLDDQLEADLDRLDRAFAGNGIDGLTTGSRGFETWRGGGGHPTVTGWTCPNRQACPRAVPVDDGDPPVCGLTGEPFVETRITL
ncbi:hypothetical protein [Plantactinospora endophytica]|nr:hypothetical protein [Plantactinospora endophytica]